MPPYWLSVIPLLIVIPVVLITKQVIPGLVLGLLLGSYLKEPSILGGLGKSITYITGSLSKESNLLTIIFLYLFSGMIELVKVTGGIKGFAETVKDRITSSRGAMLLTWISIIGTLSAPTLRVVTVTPIMKALLERLKTPARELAFIIETTSAPIIVLVPVATSFVGYMTSLVNQGLEAHAIKEDAYLLFIKSIPYNFFAIIMIILGLYLSFFHHEEKEELAETKSGAEDQKTVNKDWHDCHPVVARELPTKPYNLILPIFLLLLLTLLISWLNGYQGGRSILESFLKADVLLAMVMALIITVIMTVIFFLGQKIPFQKITSHFILGGNELMKVILLLTLVWGLAAAAEDLGLSRFITENSGWIPDYLVAPVLFLLGSLISYFIGSSWGTWGIFMPLGISLARASGTSLPLVIGAVFASGTFGGFASPLSGTTITITKILDLPLIEYVKYKVKSALIAAVIAAILYAVAPLLIP